MDAPACFPGFGLAASLSAPVGILGTGYYVPEDRLTNAELAPLLGQSEDWILERSGIRERRVARSDQASSDLGLVAAQRALERAALRPEDIDAVLVTTFSPDHLSPSTACILQNALGVPHAAAMDLNAACSGFVYGFATAISLIRSGMAGHVLLVGAETLSRFTNRAEASFGVLLGDGAGAMVLGPVARGAGALSLVFGSNGAGAHSAELPAGGSRLPASSETLATGLHAYRQDGKAVYRFATRVFQDATMEALGRAEARLEDISWLFPHQANGRIIESGAKRLGIAPERVWVNADRFGNTSSASIPIAIAEADEQGRLHPGAVIAAVGFGAGLVWGATVIRWV